MVDEDVGDDPKAMQFAKMDVPEVYMATNDEELIMKLEQVGTHAFDTRREKTTSAGGIYHRNTQKTSELSSPKCLLIL